MTVILYAYKLSGNSSYVYWSANRYTFSSYHVVYLQKLAGSSWKWGIRIYVCCVVDIWLRCYVWRLLSDCSKWSGELCGYIVEYDQDLDIDYGSLVYHRAMAIMPCGALELQPGVVLCTATEMIPLAGGGVGFPVSALWEKARKIPGLTNFHIDKGLIKRYHRDSAGGGACRFLQIIYQ